MWEKNLNNNKILLQALKNKLLSIVMGLKESDIKEKKNKLTTHINVIKSSINKSENEFFEKISTSKKPLLQDIDLLESLRKIKANIREMTLKIDQDKNAMADIQETSEGYRPVATRGAVLFFVLTDLAALEPMYQYSLSSYLELFTRSLKQAPSLNVSMTERIDSIIETLTINIFDYGCLGIFEKHKVLLSFHICTKIQLSIGCISQEELNFFINENTSVENSQRNHIQWLPSSSLTDIFQLSVRFENFSDLYNELQVYSNDWYRWYKSDTPESSTYPGEYSKKLSPFQKLMLIKCFRIDRVYSGIIKYVTDCLGVKIITPRIISFETIYKQINSYIPAVLILSPRVELTTEFTTLAEFHGFNAEKLMIIFLGKGQEKVYTLQ